MPPTADLPPSPGHPRLLPGVHVVRRDAEHLQVGLDGRRDLDLLVLGLGRRVLAGLADELADLDDGGVVAEDVVLQARQVDDLLHETGQALALGLHAGGEADDRLGVAVVGVGREAAVDREVVVGDDVPGVGRLGQVRLEGLGHRHDPSMRPRGRPVRGVRRTFR